MSWKYAEKSSGWQQKYTLGLPWGETSFPRVLKFSLIEATLSQDFYTVSKEPNGKYVVRLYIEGFGHTDGWKFDSDSWENAQGFVEAILYALSLSLSKEFKEF